jgi:hypothetical protein
MSDQSDRYNDLHAYFGQQCKARREHLRDVSYDAQAELASLDAAWDFSAPARREHLRNVIADAQNDLADLDAAWSEDDYEYLAQVGVITAALAQELAEASERRGR